MSGARDISDELPGELRRIAQVAGLEAAVRIGRAYRGSFIYVPGLDEINRKIRDSAMRAEYDRGESIRSIALKYALSERMVRRILDSPHQSLPEELVRLLKDTL